MRPRLDHEAPDWVRSDATYFVTVCVQDRSKNTLCHPDIGKAILASVQWRNENHLWYCSLALLMPDHAHLLINLPEEASLSKVVRDWKSWLAKEHGIAWQENFFDHRLRKEESGSEKTDYIVHNPVRARLVGKMEDWPYIWMPCG